MSSCLGIYVDKNLIKYAKLKKEKNSFKVEAFNIEVFEDLKLAIEKIISETNSFKIPISINVSNEIYNYFETFTVLDKKDITKALDIQFEMLCDEKGYDKSAVESRYILMDDKEDVEKYKALYISTRKQELDEKIKMLSNHRLFTMAPISTSITNLLEKNEKENIAIVNLENETTITIIADGQITRVDVLNSGLEEVIEKVNKVELSLKKAYEVCKNITISNSEVQSLEVYENEHIELIMPVLEKIATEMKKLFKSYKEKISKVYITGMGATISNIELYLQDYLTNVNCEILKPFFIDANSLKTPTKEYIEVNSAIALALDGLGYINRDLNFAPGLKFDNIEIENILNSKEKLNIKNIKQGLKNPFTIQEKTIARIIVSFIIAMIAFSVFSTTIYKNNKEQLELAKEKITQIETETGKIDSDLSKIESYTNVYISLINSAKNLSSSTTNAQKSRMISKNAIPNMLKRIMFIIPKQVQIISIENTEDNHIVIEAVSEKYEQLGFFLTAIEEENILENFQSTTGDKSDSLVKIIIEGDLK